LGRPDADLAEVQGALKEIAAQAVRAGDIIRRLRSLAQPHVDRREPTEINVLITELTALVRSDAHAHDVQYRLELSDGLPPLEVHRTQIQHVILNLVRNAIESLPRPLTNRVRSWCALPGPATERSRYRV